MLEPLWATLSHFDTSWHLPDTRILGHRFSCCHRIRRANSPMHWTRQGDRLISSWTNFAAGSGVDTSDTFRRNFCGDLSQPRPTQLLMTCHSSRHWLYGWRGCAACHLWKTQIWKTNCPNSADVIVVSCQTGEGRRLFSYVTSWAMHQS